VGFATLRFSARTAMPHPDGGRPPPLRILEYGKLIFVGYANFNNQNTPISQDILTVGRWWLINSTISKKFNQQLQARFIVDNEFNKQPPFAALSGSGGNFANATSQYFAGILGRSLVLSLDYKFCQPIGSIIAFDDGKGAARRLSFKRIANLLESSQGD
jgi:hypothetical protein